MKKYLKKIISTVAGRKKEFRIKFGKGGKIETISYGKNWRIILIKPLVTSFRLKILNDKNYE